MLQGQQKALLLSLASSAPPPHVADWRKVIIFIGLYNNIYNDELPFAVFLLQASWLSPQPPTVPSLVSPSSPFPEQHR